MSRPNGCFPLTFPFSNKLCLFGRGSTAAAAFLHKVPTGWNVTERPGWWILIASIDPADRTAVRSWWHHPSSASPWWHIDSSSNLSGLAAHLHGGLLVGFLENTKRLQRESLWVCLNLCFKADLRDRITKYRSLYFKMPPPFFTLFHFVTSKPEDSCEQIIVFGISSFFTGGF